MNTRHTRKITKLLARSLREAERGKACYRRSGDALDQALAAGVPLGEPLTIPARKKRGGEVIEPERKIVVVDNFPAGKTTAFTTARFAKFSVEPYREPKPPKLGTCAVCGRTLPLTRSALGVAAFGAHDDQAAGGKLCEGSFGKAVPCRA